MIENKADVLIIGAGAAGLMAAYKLSLAGKKVILFEARDRTGGRICTIDSSGFAGPVEAGAEFVHGHLKLTLELLEKAKIKYREVGGELWRLKNGALTQEDDFVEDNSGVEKKLKGLKHDMPVSQFLDDYLYEDKDTEARASLKGYVEGYYAADITRASTFALRDELLTSDFMQYRVEGGYKKLILFLREACTQHGCRIFCSSPVTHINWQKDSVRVTAKEKEFTAGKAIITVPLGVLQLSENDAGYIRFSPGLPQITSAAKSLGFGGAIKILLQFTEPFWKNNPLENAGFIFSDEPVPTWWTQHPVQQNLLTGWVAGPKAAALKDLSEEEILQKAIQSLSVIFKRKEQEVHQNVQASFIYNWISDPYSSGAYAYQTVNASTFQRILKTPVENVLFFAGEALYEGIEIGTVEAALSTGQETAAQVLASLA